MLLGQMGINLQKNEVHFIRKVNSKWINYLNIRAKAIKLLDESIGRKLHAFRFGKRFLAVITEV